MLADGTVVICDRYLASSIAYGEAQGLDGAWLREIQRYLPPPDLTILLDIAPETAAGRKTANRDKYERDLALLSRVRESYRRQAAAAAGCASTASGAKDVVAADVLTAVVATARAAVSARTSAAPASSSATRAGIQRRARRAHVVHQDDRPSLHASPPPPREGAAHVGVAPRRRQIRLRRRPPRARRARRRSGARGAAQISRAWLKPRARSRDGAAARRRRGRPRPALAAGLAHPRREVPRDRRRPSYFSAWTIARSVPSYGPMARASERAAWRRRQRGHSASATLSDPPRRQRIAARPAAGRRDRDDGGPAGRADGAAGGLVEGPPAGGADRREQHRDRAVGQRPEEPVSGPSTELRAGCEQEARRTPRSARRRPTGARASRSRASAA